MPRADLFSFRTYFRELQLNQAEVPVVEVGGRCYQAPKGRTTRSSDFQVMNKPQLKGGKRVHKLRNR